MLRIGFFVDGEPDGTDQGCRKHRECRHCEHEPPFSSGGANSILQRERPNGGRFACRGLRHLCRRRRGLGATRNDILGMLVRSLTNHGYNNVSLMRGAAMFKDENTLPDPQLEFTTRDGNDFARSRQRHTEVARHIVGPLRNMNEIACTFRNQAVEESVEIGPGGTVGIFVNDEAGAGVLDEDSREPCNNTTLTNDPCDFGGNFVRPFAAGADTEPVGMGGEISHTALR